MHPYGGSPRCPRCEKAVYAAEQAMGPGRRLYHKACLTCADCGKRLDSFSLVEHDEEPYCKNCHRKNFGTRDLRQANLPHLPELSPTRTGSTFPPPSPTRTGIIINDHNSPFSFARAPAPAALLRPTRALSPTRTTFAPIGNFDAVAEGDEVGAKDKEVDPDAEEDLKEEEEVADVLRFPPGTPSATGTHASGLPRSGQISPTRPQARLPTKTIPAPPFEEEDGDAVGDMKSAAAATFGPSPALPPRPTPMVTMTVGRHTGAPLMQTPTGSRYGTSTTPLRATPTGTNRWGGSTPQCPACSKSVYFAEQVKAVGKTWHKACLRCTQCGTSLDASKVTEKDGVPHCHRCYNKLHGPAGQGYALLGKAGG